MPSRNTPPSCQTVSGLYIEPCNPDPRDITIHDVAHCLACAPRWSGNCNDLSEDRNPIHYSVAQHSCHVHDIVARLYPESGAAFYALHHDSSEAYLVDIPRPIKGELTNYYALEANLMEVIQHVFGFKVDSEIKEIVKKVDNDILFWERDALVGVPPTPYLIEDQHPGGTLYEQVPAFTPWSPKRAKAEFLMRHHYHTEGRRALGASKFATHLQHFANECLGFTAVLCGLSHLDFPRVA